MIEQLSPFTRRCLALGLLTFAVLSLDTALFAPWRDQRAALRQQIEADRSAIERYRNALAGLDAEVQAIQALQDSPLRAAFLETAGGVLPSTVLQNMVKSAADLERIDIESLQFLPKRKAGDVSYQGLALAFDASFPALLRFIDAIEGNMPLVRLSRLELQSGADGAGPLIRTTLGDEVDGMRILEITARELVLEGQDGEVEVIRLRSNDPEADGRPPLIEAAKPAFDSAPRPDPPSRPETPPPDGPNRDLPIWTPEALGQLVSTPPENDE